MTTGRLFDEGAALERTQMAWVRTGLGFLATCAIAARLMLERPTWLAVGVAVVGGVSAVALLLVGHQRYRRVHADLWTSHTDPVLGVAAATTAVRAATVAVLVLSTLLVASVLL